MKITFSHIMIPKIKSRQTTNTNVILFSQNVNVYFLKCYTFLTKKTQLKEKQHISIFVPILNFIQKFYHLDFKQQKTLIFFSISKELCFSHKKVIYMILSKITAAYLNRKLSVFIKYTLFHKSILDLTSQNLIFFSRITQNLIHFSQKCYI